uniref:Uncharacterized protein n=1 Tax=Ursus maritimus TaxID=29073 RepID=A0A452T407_URSMA
LRQFLIIPGLPIGVGLALCKRLLEEDEELHVCLACRNVGKAEAVRAALLASHPTAEVSVVQVDVSNVQSVIRAARELKQSWFSSPPLLISALASCEMSFLLEFSATSSF